jgi:hypothetical protein
MGNFRHTLLIDLKVNEPLGFLLCEVHCIPLERDRGAVHLLQVLEINFVFVSVITLSV